MQIIRHKAWELRRFSMNLVKKLRNDEKMVFFFDDLMMAQEGSNGTTNRWAMGIASHFRFLLFFAPVSFVWRREKRKKSRFQMREVFIRKNAQL
jgi:hypothetical protein